VGAGALGEDIQNQCRSIDDLYVELFFQVLLLVRRQFIIEDKDVKACGIL